MKHARHRIGRWRLAAGISALIFWVIPAILFVRVMLISEHNAASDEAAGYIFLILVWFAFLFFPATLILRGAFFVFDRLHAGR